MCGKLVVIAGPSGVGKGSIVRKVLQQEENCVVSVSATTRLPRDGEKNGQDYFFLTAAEFVSRISAGEMLEHEEYSGNYYGTPREYVESNLKKGKNVILEIDAKGALAVKKTYPDALLIFLLPPSLAALRERLEGRGTEKPEEVEQRVKLASWEMQQTGKFDAVLVNDDLEETTQKVLELIRTRAGQTAKAKESRR